MQSPILNPQSPIINRQSSIPNQQSTGIDTMRPNAAETRARTREANRHTPRLSSSLVIPPSPRHSRPRLRHSREGGNLGRVDAGTPAGWTREPQRAGGNLPSHVIPAPLSSFPRRRESRRGGRGNPNAQAGTHPPTSFPHPPTSFPRRREPQRARGNPSAHNMRKTTHTHHGDTP